MERKIIGYHLDELNDWVAELDCFHGQHVRHNLPLSNRPWVVTEEGRKSKLGVMLNCVRCDELEFPENLSVLNRTADFNENSIPEKLKIKHATSVGVWGIIHLLEGSLIYTTHASEIKKFEIKKGEQEIIVPCLMHTITPIGKVLFHIEFYSKNIKI